MKDRNIQIAGISVGPGHPPFIIAEMSGNHDGSLDNALEIVDAVAKAGAHALKIQTYTADTMTIDCEEKGFVIEDSSSLWHGQTLYGLYHKAHTPWDWHEPIFERARKNGLVPFSSPFDESAVDFLMTLEVPVFKVASFENTDHGLIKKIASTGKPIIISTGMATERELEETVQVARDHGCQDLILLKCTSEYPALHADANLATIPHMKERFDTQVGLSDHTLGLATPLAAVTLGATVIEKHFVMSRSSGAVDSAFSLEPHEMKALVEESKNTWSSIGKVNYGPASEKERKSLQYRRTLYFVEDLAEGEVLTSKNVRAIRPGYGLPPKYLDKVLGGIAKVPIKRGTPLDWDLFQLSKNR